ncbi:MAG: helix-turn-helix domain-containing protein [Propionibacterium sp.]|jgi:excisionase family DNA binding protein|nr:helix-turn-helix domain-containing protein [Propionibacterium sp.]
MPKSNDLAELTEQYGRFVTYPQAAEITTASVRTLKRLTAAGELPCYQVGRTRTLRLKTSDVAKLIRRVA